MADSAATTNRAAITRDRLIRSALVCFCVSGFDGVSVRAIERAAGVERGLIAYHFSSKERLWEEAVDFMFVTFSDELDALQKALRDVSRRERARAMMLAYVRFNVAHPEFFRLIVLEGFTVTRRSEYLAGHLNRWKHLFWSIIDAPEDASLNDTIVTYVMIGAAGTLFATPAYHGPDLREQLLTPDTEETFAQLVAALFLGGPATEAVARRRSGAETPPEL